MIPVVLRVVREPLTKRVLKNGLRCLNMLIMERSIKIFTAVVHN